MYIGVIKFEIDNQSSVNAFTENLFFKKINTLEVNGNTVKVEYQESCLDIAKALIKRSDVVKAEGKLIDDGEHDLNEAGKFRIYKEDGKGKIENTVFLSELSTMELLDELRRREEARAK